MSDPGGNDAPTLASRLSEARVELRPELEVSRHVFRGVSAYVLHDPITFQSSRFSVADYRILTRLKTNESLGEVFEALVHEGALRREEEERFYFFVFQMHRQGLLKLPIADDKVLYKRHVARAKAKRSQWLASVLFRRIPVWNPDRFLVRTMRFVTPLLGRRATVAWGALMALAGWILFRNWEQFKTPVADIFGGANLVWLWVTLIGLKVFHEFGHAYVCRYFGGHVPEMGIFLILFTPCAYVDATASWSFPRKRDRIFVCLGGMYVELAIAAVAVLAWSVLPPGLVRSLLHNVVMLASITTVAFNVNPLMRYDGYYALCDLVETPNLRGRATAAAVGVLKRVFLGLPSVDGGGGRGYRSFLVGFGVASGIYKVFLVLGIATVIAMKFFVVGIALGLLYAGGEILRICKRTIPYLLKAEETRPVRRRAVACSAILFGGLPLLVAGVPLPSRVAAPGVVGAERELVLRAETSGFLDALHVVPGEELGRGGLVAVLQNAETEAVLLQSEGRLEGARVLLNAAEEPALREAERERVLQLEGAVEHSSREVERLQVRTRVEGLVVSCLDPHERGRFIESGDPIATIAAGRPIVRALLSAEDMAAVGPRIGQPVEFRSVDRPLEVVHGTVLRMGAMGTREPDPELLDRLDSVQLAVDPATGRTGRAQFELVVAIESADLRPGTSGRVRFVAEPETIARRLLRKGLLLLEQIRG